jgi:acetyl-CoA C-acetyltransferase
VVGSAAFEEAGVTVADVDYASIYDSFTITVLETIEDLGFCAKGEGGRFVLDGALVAPSGSCRSTPTAADSATTTRPTGAA